jgi:hypothetical protein
MNITYNTQNNLLLNNLLEYYNDENNLNKLIKIITGETKISLRIVDWFSTNYSKKYYTKYTIDDHNEIISKQDNNITTTKNEKKIIKVYIDYKLKLKAFSKKRFDAFCRSKRITIPYKNKYIETTLGQLNFFQWAIKNKIIDYIDEHFEEIEKDMNTRNSISKNKKNIDDKDKIDKTDKNKIRKKRQELSLSATKSIKKENVEIIVSFH